MDEVAMEDVWTDGAEEDTAGPDVDEATKGIT